MKRAENRKHHYIYKTTCTVTGRFYIGMHSTDSLDDGYVGSGKLLWYSIRKYGKENHVTEILEHTSTRDALKLRETQIVNEELLGNHLCMNLKLGGEGGWDRVNETKQNTNIEGCRKGGLRGGAKCAELKLGWLSPNCKRPPQKKKVSDEQLLEAFNKTNHISKALLSLGLAKNGGSRRRIMRLLETMNISSN